MVVLVNAERLLELRLDMRVGFTGMARGCWPTMRLHALVAAVAHLSLFWASREWRAGRHKPDRVGQAAHLLRFGAQPCSELSNPMHRKLDKASSPHTLRLCSKSRSQRVRHAPFLCSAWLRGSSTSPESLCSATPRTETQRTTSGYSIKVCGCFRVVIIRSSL